MKMCVLDSRDHWQSLLRGGGGGGNNDMEFQADKDFR